MRARSKNWARLGIRLTSQPELNNPILVAAWPGVGNIALRAISYLREKLGAEQFGEIDPRPYTDLPGVFIEDNVIQPPRFPTSQMYFWRRPGQGRDLIIYLGDTQPSHDTYELAHRVMDVAEYLGVDTVYTLAAALLAEPPESPRVWGTASEADLIAMLKEKGAVLKGSFFVAGMNGLLLAVAKERGLRGVCLLGETPRLIPQVDNPIASLAVLRVLCRALDIEIDMKPLETMAEEAKSEISRILMETQKKYLEDFTIPLWQRDEESQS